jgi:hypothetical protein
MEKRCRRFIGMKGRQPTWHGLSSQWVQVTDLTLERWIRLGGGTRFPACEAGANFLSVFMRSKAHATLVD